MALQKDLREFIQSLNSSGVDFLIVGAYAVAFHGRPRLTGDIDLFVRRSKANAKQIARAIAEFSGGSILVDAAEFEVPGRMLRLGVEPNRIDILTSISGVEFDEVWARRISSELDGVPVLFISLEDLLKNKRSTGRLKDAADADELSRTDN